MNNHIYPCLWFEGDGREAAVFYTSAFADCAIMDQNAMVIMLGFGDQNLMLLNAGPGFKKNGAVSFFVRCETQEEVLKSWRSLLNGGIEVMPLEEYPWSKLYGWVQDKYGVNWQLSFNPLEEGKQRLTPTLMFNETNNGRAREAIDFYCSVFPNSEVTGILKYKDGEDIEGNIKHAEFNINGYAMMAMDTSSTYTSVFNEGISMVVLCDTQEEIDHYWKALARDGQESQCGWLKDKYQLSWQIVPTILDNLLKDSSRSKSVIEVFLKMKKFDIEKLLNA